MGSRRIIRAALGASLITSLVAAPSALGHGTLINSTPMDQDTVEVPPTEIVAMFSEPLDATLSHMELLDASGLTLATGGDAPDDASATTMRLDPPPLPAGVYEVPMERGDTQRWLSRARAVLLHRDRVTD